MPPSSAASSSFRWTKKTALLLVLLIILTAYPGAVSVAGAYVSLPSLSSTFASSARSLPTRTNNNNNNNNNNNDDDDAAARHQEIRRRHRRNVKEFTASSPSSSSGSHAPLRRFVTGTYRSRPGSQCRMNVHGASEGGIHVPHAPEEEEEEEGDNDAEDDQLKTVYRQPRFDPNWNRQGTIRTATDIEIRGSSGRRRALRVVATSLATMVVGAARETAEMGTTISAAAWALSEKDIGEGRATDAVFDPSSPPLPRSALQDRIDSNLLAQPTYGMDRPDVFYPSWFQGTWKVTSTTVNVSTPCGVALFGGNATYQRARNEIGTSLAYRARFVPTSSSSSNADMMIADREYNVVSIAQSAMGPNSMVNVEKATPNEFACTLLSGGDASNNLFRVNMLTVQRKQELGGNNVASSTSSNLQTFACSEVVQELIRPVAVAAAPAAGATGAASTPPTVAAAAPPPPLSILKQIETISVYRYDPTADPNVIDCLQRTASYLVPSQSDPMMAQLYRMSQGLPVDVRHYRVRYKKDD